MESSALRLDETIHHAELVEARARVRLAREEELRRGRAADPLHELLHERERQADPELREGHREARVRRRDADVAVERELAAAGDRFALHGRDRRLGHHLESAKDVLDAGERDRAARLFRRLHFTEIEPGAERAAVAAHDDDAHRRIVSDRREHLVEPPEHRRRHRVPLLGAVHRDEENSVTIVEQDFVGHHTAPIVFA